MLVWNHRMQQRQVSPYSTCSNTLAVQGWPGTGIKWDVRCMTRFMREVPPENDS